MLRIMRVWPSGKALASQANIHGFESRHPLKGLPYQVFLFLKIICLDDCTRKTLHLKERQSTLYILQLIEVTG